MCIITLSLSPPVRWLPTQSQGLSQVSVSVAPKGVSEDLESVPHMGRL